KRPMLSAIAMALFVIGAANDGAYLTRGGAIYPMKETRIAMAKEHLSFTCAGDVATVEVFFEFYNPDTVARTLLVGFQAPTSVGDVSDSLILASRIRDLKIMVNGKLQPITMKAAECEDCPLGSVSSFEFHQDTPGIYVYLFEVTFQPGITRVHHSYVFMASSNVSFDQMFNYILTTGSKWAGSSIKDFTVEIDMGRNQYFYVADVFGKNADWSIVGTGLVTDQAFDYIDSTTCRMVRTVSGKLVIRARDLLPKRNIEFGVCSAGSFFGVPLESASGLSERVHAALRYSTLDMAQFRMEPLTKEDLRMLRNTIYAIHGYAFKDKELRSFFERFPWYVPEPSLDLTALGLSREEQGLINGVIEMEKGAK
ncbi:MAG TPA: YARHG domain-containing protein, partial [Flavobacteriales bacterium]|nr:YARHG domain-containing protein [Flavobacteriales bacterium]